MIIGIDETGDFKVNSDKKSFFIAILLEQHNGNIEKKKEQFNNWLNTIPNFKFNEKGEVKGSDLNEDELLTFTNMVYTNSPCVRMEIVFFIPSKNPESLIKGFKNIEVEKLKKMADLSKKEGKQHKAKQYENMSIWHKNAKKMHYPHYMKLLLLKKLIAKTFNTVVGVSILLEMLGDKKSENLLNIEFKIDYDFIRAREPEIFWKELLRNTFISHTMKEPIPLLDEWKKKGHPFIEKYKNEKDDNTLLINRLIQENCKFYNSDEHFEIQIADITGIIINRFYNKGKAEKAFKNLKKCISHYGITELILSENPDMNTDPIIIE